ncbi:hypothetical protein SAMN05518672_11571 [Chitinophaga sp. CF118]|uniref:hypothetical protein n=1 Tax=Chitinophaga sp. CF118 TaxID=1884367 RepID=UPI0008E2485F|nr:hypothetical protein [Chitinophaga sp. CF118]SFF07301.1 hypothetical protein SAMN05518672_11571 [Chitinophaga sp. CF118]
MMNEDKPKFTGTRSDQKDDLQKGIADVTNRLSLPNFEHTPKKPDTNPPRPAQDANQGKEPKEDS